MGKPAFDPSRPFERTDVLASNTSKPPFDPNANFSPAGGYSNDENPVVQGLIAAGKGGLGLLNSAARTVDRYTGAPTRAAISAAQNADHPTDIPADAVKAGWAQFGEDPDKAPTGEDIVKKAGVPEGWPSKAAGLAMDVAANPLNFVDAPAILSRAYKVGAPLAKGLVSRGSELMTGVPKEAVERLIERPAQVMSAENEGNALDVARKARQEFLGRNESERDAIQGARKQFRDKFGGESMDNAPIQQSIADFETHNAPNAQGYGPVSEKDMGDLGKIKDSLDSANAGDLQKLSDHLQTQIDNFQQARSPGSGDTRSQAYLRSLYGQVKDRLHEIDPQGLGKADARFSEYADNAGRLGKLENEDQMEGLINNFYGKNKTLMRESADKIIPNSSEDIADIGASRAFEKQGPAGSEMGRRAVGGVAAGTALALTGHPIPGAVVAAATSPAAHKAVIGNAAKAIDAIKSADWFKALKANPEILQNVSDPSLRKILGNAIEESAPSFAQPDSSDSERKPAEDKRGLLPNRGG